MRYDCILIRYGELALKKKNRDIFVGRLVKNISDKLAAFPQISIVRTRGRLFVELNGLDHEPIISKLKEVFGIVGLSPAWKVPSDIERLKEKAFALVQNQAAQISTFKVVSKRTDKQFPYRSEQINREIGGYILSQKRDLKVNVHQPDLLIHIEVRGQFSYIYGNDILGLGGLPVGVSGSVMLLLSGGIDSPVAGYLTSKRGGELWAVHFHSFPFTSERAKQKVIDLAQHLTRYTGSIRLLVVPFTEIQTQINEHCYSSYSITIMRRFMIRISESLAKKHRCLALVTGESLGQVASQTLESMNVINAVTNLPILRPLIGMDKLEITNLAKKIGTYETSILPYEDCCTVFLPKSPKTNPQLHVVEKQEKLLKIEQLVQEAVKNTEIIDLSPEQENKEFSYF